MIKFKNLTIKNFMSVGNVTQAVDFDKAMLTLVLGENLDQGGDDTGSRNGTGKTTIINGLSYALYGQALTNIKRNNLINKTNNKGMIVTLTFEKSNNKYRIERGRSPNILKFYINDTEQLDNLEDQSQGDSRETQKNIDSLLGMSHNMFKHIVALNTYTEPFLSMRTNDQREIIEQLLGITLLSEKASVLKDKIRETKDTIQSETLKINAIQSSNEKIRKSIDTLISRQSAWNSKSRQDCEKLTNGIINLEKVDALLKDKVSVVSGNSGVGKSSLLNKISSDFELRTSEISEAHEQGVHTTTFAEMFELPDGGFVIDTPGIRGLGIVDIEREELGDFFPEILRFKPKCKFNNCVHVNEPKCAVKAAVEAGNISEERYNSYLSIFNNDETEHYR